MRWNSRNRFRRRWVSGRRAACAALGVVFAVALADAAVRRAGAEAGEPARPAVIDFVDLGGIRDWRAEGDRALLIESANGSWFRATFFGACPGLQFQQRLAFVTDGTNQLNRFSSVLIDRQRCWFQTFEQVEAPASERAREKP